MPSQEEVEFYLSEDISENTENSSFTDHIFHDDVTNESMIEIVTTENIEKSFETCLVDNFKSDKKNVDFDLVDNTKYPSFTNYVVQIEDINESIREPFRTKNILESLDTCSVSNETGKFENFKVGEEEVIFDLSEDTKCHSFMDPNVQIVIFDDYTNNILQAKNPNKSFEIYLVDTGTIEKDNQVDKEFTYHKPKLKYIHLKDLEKYLQIEKEDHRMDPEWNYKKRKKYYLERTHLIK